MFSRTEEDRVLLRFGGPEEFRSLWKDLSDILTKSLRQARRQREYYSDTEKRTTEDARTSARGSATNPSIANCTTQS
jgi:hypothetical protein